MSPQAAPPVRVAVLISGAGSNMAALIDAGQAPDSGYEVVLVLSNIEGAGGLAIAAAKGVATATVAHKPFGKDREAHERAVDAVLRDVGVEVVALAGYMRVLTPWLVGGWRERMLNIHPSLLPLYPGLDTHARAIAAGELRRPAEFPCADCAGQAIEYDHRDYFQPLAVEPVCRRCKRRGHWVRSRHE